MVYLICGILVVLAFLAGVWVGLGMAIYDPDPWTATGCGSFREIRKGVLQVRCRPHGTSGPRLNRTVAGTAREIRALLARKKANQARRRQGLPQLVTWDDAIEEYANHLEAQGRTRKHIGAVTLACRLFQEGCGLELSDVTGRDVQGWLNTVAEEARARGRPGWARTANCKRALLHGLFRYLHRLEVFGLNPVAATFPFKQPRREKRTLLPEEYAAVWTIAEPSVRDLMDFLLLTGCRFGEAAKLKVGDISGAGEMTFRARKGGDNLRLNVDSLVLEIMLRQPKGADGLVWHKWVAPRVGAGPPRRFREGGPVDGFWFRRVVRERCRLAGVADFRTHDLRHAAATWARQAGIPMQFIQDALGHSSVTTTEIYAHAGKSGPKVVQATLRKMRDEALNLFAKEGLRP